MINVEQIVKNGKRPTKKEKKKLKQLQITSQYILYKG